MHGLTVDQIGGEVEAAREALAEAQRAFSEGQLRGKKEDYAAVCRAHEALFD